MNDFERRTPQSLFERSPLWATPAGARPPRGDCGFHSRDPVGRVPKASPVTNQSSEFVGLKSVKSSVAEAADSACAFSFFSRSTHFAFSAAKVSGFVPARAAHVDRGCDGCRISSEFSACTQFFREVTSTPK